ncbi:hypothetical protein GDO81_008665 [Engystomops pustulosus]|uniref:ETAA1 activator of ATR kinase n=2 Tax=Engystomops pustulosus TaxID=76066 RepID=A0AAV7CHB7_ENGPU|nr:hypothetical protein GDO81_008665 [Engystomops pustulosus]
MTSRRRARQISEDGDGGERRVLKERKGDCDRETPKKSSRRLSRSTRSGGARPSSQSSSSVAPRSDKEEEPFSNKKTPQRFPKCKPWTSTINSPSNDADQQQDIFWDPHSPTTFKLENGRRKLAANKCTVDISDIVNRIAPKNEKPSSSEAAYLGIWIGEDAIPCTPVVARTRTKMPRSRILQTEEELMKLAKQLDSNLVKQKDQNEEQLANSDDEMFNECAMNNVEDSFLEDLPEEDEDHLKSVSQRSVPQGSSQRSLDQDMEAAVNALFDSSTQKYSGRLSQGASDVSTSSANKASAYVFSNIQEEIPHSKKEPLSDKHKTLEQFSFVPKIPTNTAQYSEPNIGKETVQAVSSSQDDFEDDWGNDLLEDDSFIMQVTQNPELIATPKNNIPPDKPGQTNTHPAGREVRSASASSPKKTNNFKFVPRKIHGGSEAKPSNLCSTKTTYVNTFQGNAKAFSSTQVPSKSHVIKNNVHNSVHATNSAALKISQKAGVQAAPQTRAATVTKDDEWDDLKFSDEVLDMFCESDSLFEVKEDDDDLLYQVCDDVERLTQAQESSKTNSKKETPQLPTSKGQIPSKPGTNASQQNKNGSHVTASSSFGSQKLNNRGVSPASFSGNCSKSYQNSSLQKSNQTYSRSVSVPSGGECKSTILSSGHSENPPLAGTNPVAPSKYSFTRIKPSQATSAHTGQSLIGNWSGSNSLNPQRFGESRNNRDTFVQSNSDIMSKPQQSSLKRHLSESTIQSSKVFLSEDKSKKCSMEEIERKKQEALARRKMKACASSDTAPT